MTGMTQGRVRESRRLNAFLRRFARARHGGIALNFALIALPLAVLSLGLIDVNRASMSKRTLQDALDAAALIVAKSDADTNAEADAIGDAALQAQLASFNSDDGVLATSTFTLSGTNSNTVLADASITVDPVVANLWLQGDMSVGAHSEVLRSAYNLEVSLVLDITYSMVGTPLADLKVAAADLVDLVVQPVQTPYYSKVAIVPYSMGVNLGSNAATARGAVAAGKTITGAAWANGTGKGISGITRANPAVVTANSHGFNNGDRVYIEGVSGMTQVNDRVFTVANKTTNTFQLSGVNSSSYNSYSSSSNDFATKCLSTDCEVVVTSNNHGFATSSWVYITGVGGMTGLNNKAWQVTNLTASTYRLEDSFGPDYNNFSSNGTGYCTTVGCEYYRYTGRNGSTYVQRVSTCVSERTGANKYTDVAPSTSFVGYNYAASGVNDCLSATITGLTSNKTALKNAITGYVAEGSTAGHIGLEWGWYSVSPNFASIFGGTTTPAAYTTPDLKKVVILMTDGEFNTAYCNGVISKDSSVGFGFDTHAINCNATNDDGFDQAKAVCAAMKAKGIVIYTVGFNISSSTAVTDLLSTCASSAQHAYLPSSGTALKDAFKAIGQDISSLRISR